MNNFFFFLSIVIFSTIEARLYFIHIPKTAGSTMRHLLEMQVDPDQIYPHRNQNTAKELIQHDLVSGHLPYWLCKRLDPDFDNAFKITVLRDPIERYLSFLRSKKKKNSRHPDLESVMNERFSPHNPYRLGLVDNLMCRFLSASPHLDGEELLQSAKEGLEKLDCVLFVDSFAEDTVQLFSRLGIPLTQEEIPNLNQSPKETVSAELLEKIRLENLWDLLLYEYAKTTLPKKETEYSLRLYCDHSKNVNLSRRRLEFEPGEAGAESLGSLKMPHFRGKLLQLNLKSLAMQAGSNSMAVRRWQIHIF